MKKSHYLVLPTSHDARIRLVDYLEKHGFTYINDATRESTISSPYPVIIDVAQKTVYHIENVTSAAASVPNLISEDEFYKSMQIVR